MELKRFFDIDEPLCKENAEDIYVRTKALIAEKNITPRWCMEHSHVELVSTTEDPVDDLKYHIAMNEDPTLKTENNYRFPHQIRLCLRQNRICRIHKALEKCGRYESDNISAR